MHQHLLAGGKSLRSRIVEHLVVEVQSLVVKIENLRRNSQFVVKVSFTLINDVSLDGVIGVSGCAVRVVYANLLKQNIRRPAECGEVCRFGHVVVVVNPFGDNAAVINVEWGRHNFAGFEWFDMQNHLTL